MSTDRPQWTGLRDKHASCQTELGSMWIRTNTDGNVTGVYTLFGQTVKHVPGPDETWSVEDGKLIAELALEMEKILRNQSN